jgi:tetratricopeptide (TPR) repeat protein
MSRVQIEMLIRQAQAALNGSQLNAAIGACDEVLQRDPRNPEALTLRGQAAFAGGSYDEAASSLKRAVAISPRDPRPQLVLAEVRVFQGRYSDAIAAYDKVLRIQPAHPRAVAGKADAWEKSGERAKAQSVLAPYVDSGRESAEMALIQARLYLHAGNHEALIDLARRHVERPETSPSLRWHLYAIMGRALERSGRYDEAFAAWQRSKECLPAPFSPEGWVRSTDEVIRCWSPERLASLPRAAHGSEVPVLIVGMPRCGSTLVETILDSHPQARGAGELPAIADLVGGMGLRIGSDLPYPACIEDLGRDDVESLAASYLDRLRSAAGAAADRIVDKALNNYRHLGLVELLVPRARVIHCRRHPLDTCLSCFEQTLFPSAYSFTADLRNLGLVYVQYERLMGHWRKVLALPVLDVQYEALVADAEAQTRRILEFCGLPWDDRCLRFHERGRVVRTASYDQVNKPIYSSSVGRWRRFEKHLAPLIEALARGGWTRERLEADPAARLS